MIARNVLLSAASLCLVALPAGIFFFADSNSKDLKSRPVTSLRSEDLARVRRMAVHSEIKFPGQLEAVEIIDLVSAVSGMVSEVRFRTGDRVRAGAVMAIIRVSGLQERLADQRERIASAEKDLRTREIEWEKAEREIAKRRELIGQDLIPRRDMVDAEASAETAKAALELARAHLAQQQAISAQAAEANALGQLRAPIAGEVIRITARAGDFVREGTVVLSLGDADRLKFVARLDDARTYGSLVGAEARISVRTAARSPTEIPGTVSRVRDEQDGGSLVEIELQSGLADLRIGMNAEAKISVLPGRDLLVVPRRAVSRDEDKAYVDVYNGKGTERRDVELGPELGDSVVVFGLSEGDRVYAPATGESGRSGLVP